MLFEIGLIIQMFVLLNPLSSFPILVSAYKNKMNVRKIALNSVFLAFIIAVIIAVFGPNLFALFGISIDSFRIAGGIVLLLLGINTINEIREKDKVDKVDSLVSLIATPLLTGPATISFITIKSIEIGKIPLLFNIVVSFLFVGIAFYAFSASISKINMKIVTITSRILGLFLAAIGIEMIFVGLRALL